MPTIQPNNALNGRHLFLVGHLSVFEVQSVGRPLGEPVNSRRSRIRFLHHHQHPQLLQHP